MNKQEIDMLFQKLSWNYPKENFSEKLIKEWSSVLSEYDYADVNENLDILLADKVFLYVPPKLMTLVSGLTKKYKKVDFNKIVYFCQFCRRPFNAIEDLHNHEDRCRAIRYIESKSNKYNWDFNIQRKAQLYQMTDSDFKNFYDSFLKSVQKVTNSEFEKQMIENIFNPPREREAKEFLGVRNDTH